jgi:hypothetical protein
MGKIIHVDFKTGQYDASICDCCHAIGVIVEDGLCWTCISEIMFDLEAIPLSEDYKKMIEEVVKDIEGIDLNEPI